MASEILNTDPQIRITTRDSIKAQSSKCQKLYHQHNRQVRQESYKPERLYAPRVGMRVF